jgi:peptidoglycan-associated lipoprotein
MKNYSILMAAMAALALSGCATKDYVHEYVDGQVGPVNTQVKTLDGRLGTVDGRIGAVEAGLRGQDGRIGNIDGVLRDQDGRIVAIEGTLRDQDGRIVIASRTAQEALDRAIASGRLAEGKFVYETTLADATTLVFNLEDNTMSADTMAALDAFAARLKSENKSVYIEIQGHTDSTGGEKFNLKLGAERAEAVRRYLNMKGGVPLHRMSAISYGESAPAFDNSSRANREKNRRVVLVVLR